MYKKETKVDEPINKGEVKRGTTPIHLSNWGFHWFWIHSNSNSAESSFFDIMKKVFFFYSSINDIMVEG